MPFYGGRSGINYLSRLKYQPCAALLLWHRKCEREYFQTGSVWITVPVNEQRVYYMHHTFFLSSVCVCMWGGGGRVIPQSTVSVTLTPCTCIYVTA